MTLYINNITFQEKNVNLNQDSNSDIGPSSSPGSGSNFSLEIYMYKLTNQNSIHEEIKCRLKAGNSCYYSVQTLLPSRLLSKNLKIKIHNTIILPVVLYGCETWSLTLREESRVRVLEKRTLRRIFGPNKDANGEWRRLHNEELQSLYRSPDTVRRL